jgi:hypothetical protein
MAPRRKPKKVKAEAKRPLARKPPKDDAAKVRDLERRLAEAMKVKKEALNHEAEAHEQLTATGEILRVIGSSPSELQPVFDIIAKHATALTDAVYSAVYLLEDESIHLRAYYSDDIPSTLL